MSNFKEQLREIRKEVVAAEKTRPRYDRFDPPEDVLDIRRNQKILFVGDDGPFQGAQRLCDHVGQVRNSQKLELIVENDPSMRYDLIVLSRNTILSEASLVRAVSLLQSGGLLALFVDTQELGDLFAKSVETSWPFADIWKFDTSIGPVVLTNAFGRVYTYYDYSEVLA